MRLWLNGGQRNGEDEREVWADIVQQARLHAEYLEAIRPEEYRGMVIWPMPQMLKGAR